MENAVLQLLNKISNQLTDFQHSLTAPVGDRAFPLVGELTQQAVFQHSLTAPVRDPALPQGGHLTRLNQAATQQVAFQHSLLHQLVILPSLEEGN